MYDYIKSIYLFIYLSKKRETVRRSRRYSSLIKTRRGAQRNKTTTYNGSTTVDCNLLLLFVLQSESCLLCPCLAPSTVYVDGDTKNQRKHFSLPISHPPFIPPFRNSHKRWGHYKCHIDRWELSITLLELQFVGFVAAHFTALLKCGWAKQVAQLVPLRYSQM